jgi:hypothetical protein
MELAQILTDLGLTPAEYAVLFHVTDTVVIEREGLAVWVADNLPNCVPQDLTLADCRAAIDALLRRELLVELTEADLAQDLARWRAEPLPVSWGVDRDRRIGDVDLTEAGFRIDETITRLRSPTYTRRPVQGYNDEQPGVIRVFGETEDVCQRAVEHLVNRIDQAPWHWTRSLLAVDAIRPLGPWWHSRFELISTGFEIVVHRGSAVL